MTYYKLRTPLDETNIMAKIGGNKNMDLPEMTSRPTKLVKTC
jgi:hypothetical protein